jgi:hypothetical protein
VTKWICVVTLWIILAIGSWVWLVQEPSQRGPEVGEAACVVYVDQGTGEPLRLNCLP